MIVTLDGRRVGSELSAAESLQQLIYRTQERCAPGRLIVGVVLDGQSCAGESLAARLPQPLANIGQVDLESATPAATVAEAFTYLGEQFEAQAAEQAECADLLSTGRAAEAIARLSGFIAVWQQCGAALEQARRVLGRDLSKTEWAGRTVGERLGELAARLEELRQALAARDLVMLGDTLRYELSPQCLEWSELLHRLAGDLAEEGGAT